MAGEAELDYLGQVIMTSQVHIFNCLLIVYFLNMRITPFQEEQIRRRQTRPFLALLGSWFKPPLALCQWWMTNLLDLSMIHWGTCATGLLPLSIPSSFQHTVLTEAWCGRHPTGQ